MKFCIICIMADHRLHDQIMRAAALNLQTQQLREQRELLEYEMQKEQKKKELKRKLDDEQLAEHALHVTTNLLHMAQETLGHTSMEVDRVAAREIKKPKAALREELLERAVHGTGPVPATPSGAAGGAASSAAGGAASGAAGGAASSTATPSGAPGGLLSVSILDVPIFQVMVTSVMDFFTYG
jgi:hypothetical protein